MADSRAIISLTDDDLRADKASFARLKAQLLSSQSARPTVVDLSRVRNPSFVQAALLSRLLGEARQRECPIELRGVPAQMAAALDEASVAMLCRKAPRQPRESLLERIGERTLMLEATLKGWHRSAAEALSAVLIDPLVGIPWQGRAIVAQMDQMGVRGAGIVIFISTLVGVVMGLNGAHELRQFGASLFIANLVGISITREMGPLITAALIASRSGSAIAAELGTMVVTEEIDALKTMALAPARYLVAPRLVALMVMGPCLTALSDFFGIAGGYAVGVFGLGLGSANYLRQTSQALFISDVILGLVKSAVFALLIGLISCHEGLKVRGGADGVGRAATNAAVLSIIAAVAADAVFTLLFYLLGQ